MLRLINNVSETIFSDIMFYLLIKYLCISHLLAKYATMVYLISAFPFEIHLLLAYTNVSTISEVLHCHICEKYI